MLRPVIAKYINIPGYFSVSHFLPNAYAEVFVT